MINHSKINNLKSYNSHFMSSTLYLGREIVRYGDKRLHAQTFIRRLKAHLENVNSAIYILESCSSEFFVVICDRTIKYKFIVRGNTTADLQTSPAFKRFVSSFHGQPEVIWDSSNNIDGSYESAFNYIVNNHQLNPNFTPFKVINTIKDPNKLLSRIDVHERCRCEVENSNKACLGDCENAKQLIECHLSDHNGEDCGNKRFSKNEGLNEFTIAEGPKGLSVITNIDLEPGYFLGKYAAEVITKQLYEQRIARSQDGMYFGLKAHGQPNVIFDARNEGNFTRYINHSCHPNSDLFFYSVNSVLLPGFIVNKKIKKGEEVTFDYFSGKPKMRGTKKCLCSEGCLSFIV